MTLPQGAVQDMEPTKHQWLTQISTTNNQWWGTIIWSVTTNDWASFLPLTTNKLGPIITPTVYGPCLLLLLTSKSYFHWPLITGHLLFPLICDVWQFITFTDCWCIFYFHKTWTSEYSYCLLLSLTDICYSHWLQGHWMLGIFFTPRFFFFFKGL